MPEYSKKMIGDLLAGALSSEDLQALQRQEKDPGRLRLVCEIMQERLGWKERILLPLQEHLYVVQSDDGKRAVRCDCGHDFGDYRVNWKESALVFERTWGTGAEEVHRGPRAADPDWSILREFYCPGCAAQLDVEVVPVGYPFVFNFLPDLDDADRDGA